jgi:hypothetical protein
MGHPMWNLFTAVKYEEPVSFRLFVFDSMPMTHTVEMYLALMSKRSVLSALASS